MEVLYPKFEPETSRTQNSSTNYLTATLLDTIARISLRIVHDGNDDDDDANENFCLRGNNVK
jgi:hypothetical protein